MYKLITVLFIFLTMIYDSNTRDMLPLLDEYSLYLPYELKDPKRIKDLDKMTDCNCPRVYWPVCAIDNITYVNGCIMNCLKKELRRLGPCILYRRNGFNAVELYLPKIWKKNSSTEAIRDYEDFNVTKVVEI